MAGELVPLVLVPRYTTYSCGATYTTVGMDVTSYSSAIVNLLRATGIGTSPTIAFTFQDSTDQTNWTTCANTTASFDPGADTETQYTPTLTKRWFRIKAVTSGSNPSFTCWAIGFLEKRER